MEDKSKNKKNKEVFLFDANFEFLKKFKNINSCAKDLETSFANVYLCIKNKGFLLKKFYVSHDNSIIVERKKREVNPLLRGYESGYEYKRHYVNSTPERRQKYITTQREYDKKKIRKRDKNKKLNNKTMTTQTAQTIIDTIENTNFDSLYRKSFEDADFKFEGNEENGFESDDTEYAVMFNVETESLFFLNYATKNNGWAKTAASQNPWIVVGYVSALAIIAGLEEDYLIARMQDIITLNC